MTFTAQEIADAYPLPWQRVTNNTMARFVAANGKDIAIADKGSANDKLWSFILAHLRFIPTAPALSEER